MLYDCLEVMHSNKMQNQDDGRNDFNYLARLLPVIDIISIVCCRSFSDSECLTLHTELIANRLMLTTHNKV